MASYCLLMLSMAMELADDDPAYEDVASKFFEHFVAIVDAMNTFGGTGLWDDARWLLLRRHSSRRPAPAFAGPIDGRPDSAVGRGGAGRRSDGSPARFQETARLVSGKPPRFEPAHHLLRTPARKGAAPANCWPFRRANGWNECCATCSTRPNSSRPMASARCRNITTIIRARVQSEFGEFSVNYDPGESTTGTFGGNSNWRGPIWFPVNYAIIEALERYHYFYGDSLRVECPTGSGRWMNLDEVAVELVAAAGEAVLARRTRPPPLPRRRPPLRRRSALARPDSVLRILPRRQRPRLRRQPSNRLDRAGRCGCWTNSSTANARKRRSCRAPPIWFPPSSRKRRQITADFADIRGSEQCRFCGAVVEHSIRGLLARSSPHCTPKVQKVSGTLF